MQDFLENLKRVPDVKSWVQDSETIRSNLLSTLDKISSRVSGKAGPLVGLIIGVKDNISTKEFSTKMGTSFWKGTQGGFDARVVSKLRYAGAIVAGKTRCSEFAVHKTTGTVNPRYPDNEPGTSSSGSASAIANNEVSISLGTQTAGSIIKPASYCGVIGFKPSFGEVPRTGVLKTTELFDTVGFFGRRVKDISTVYRTARMSGSDHPLHEFRRSEFESGKFDSLIVFSGEGIDCPVDLLRQRFLDLVESIRDVFSIQNHLYLEFDFEKLRKSIYNVYYRDLAYFVQDHSTVNEVSPQLGKILEFGLGITDSTYTDSRFLILTWQKYLSSIPGNPLILSLATSSGAPRIGNEDKFDANPFITSAGLPQIALPILRDDNNQLVAMSLSAKRFNDEALLNAADKLFPHDVLSIES